ncbi:hypothetical protein DYQ86_01460 [Acidobacteria bacterium AB60]|nr:hypothetical protein DYQ86_01460 [Acidobacteria bacterium AB60]
MHRLNKLFAVPVLALALTGAQGIAQEHADQDRHDNGSYRHHEDWKKGSHISHEDWDRGQRVDYREHHLRRPPEGHEWRQIDGNYVQAGPDGVISSVRVAPRNNHQRSPDHRQ